MAAPGDAARHDAIVTLGHSYPLPGYSRLELAGAQLVAQSSLMNAFAEVLSSNETLYHWASGQLQPKALRGRAPVYVATLPPGAPATIAVRHSWHGGLLAPLTRDLYLRPTRAPLELLRAFMLRECGIPTPELLGFALYPAGAFLVRVDVATRYIPDAFDLAAVLQGFAPDIARDEALLSVQALLVQMSASGFRHPDLNVKNILLTRSAASLQAIVLDVDVLQWGAGASPADTMLANAARLARSIRKSRRQFGVDITDEALSAFVAALLSATPRTRKAPQAT